MSILQDWLSADNPRVMTVEDTEDTDDDILDQEELPEDKGKEFIEKAYGKYVIQSSGLKFNLKEIAFDVLRWFFFQNYLNLRVLQKAKHAILSRRFSSRLNLLTDEDIPVMVFPSKFTRMFNYSGKIYVSSRCIRSLNINELLACLLFEYGLLKNKGISEDWFSAMNNSPIEFSVLLYSKKQVKITSEESICTLAARYMANKTIGLTAIDNAFTLVMSKGYIRKLRQAIPKLVEVPELGRLLDTKETFSTRDLFKIQKRVNRVLERSKIGKLLTFKHDSTRLFMTSKLMSKKLGINTIIDTINKDQEKTV
jgi:hypothetical protein